MISKVLLVLDNPLYLNDYRKVGVNTFLFPLKGFCVGYRDYSLDEINKIDVSNKYLLVNRVLDCNDIDAFKKIITSFQGIKGILFEDIGVYQSLKNINYSGEMILFQNHFNCNQESINFWLDRVNSVVVSNELTYKELEYITSNVKREIILHLYGYNQVMYSRRKLLTNFYDEFKIDKHDKRVIEDKATHVKFRAYENEFGTVMYSEKIFNGYRLLHMDNVKYFYVNSTLIDHNLLMSFLKNANRPLDDEEDDGFLEKETIFKLKER